MSETALYSRVLGRLLRDGNLSKQDAVLVVCGGSPDRDVMTAHGLTNVTISNLDTRMEDASVAPFAWSRQDAENLNYPNEAFDMVFVHAGLHHCHSPHRALLEMYRVARKAIVVFEARDSMAMKIARALGFTTDYEIEAVATHNFKFGGVSNGSIPNFVYRWTEGEVAKAIKSFEPRYVPKIKFFYGLLLPHDRFRDTSQPVFRLLLQVIAPLAALVAWMFPKQGNKFAFVVFKGGELHPWLTDNGGVIDISKEAVAAAGRAIKPRS